jgi:sterol desaturase/sphingolipid hydroxylase (fatty acid hydroxylase superfamily)
LILIPEKLWFYCFAFLGIILSRYFLIAGGTYLLFYSVLKKSFIKRQLRRKPLRWQLIRRDVELAILSGIVFALGATTIMLEYDLGLTLLYTDIGEYGLWYLGVSFVVVLVLQDAYFYFMHRLFHRPLLFKWLHQGHHLSGEPTPWTSFAFDPPEAIIQMLFFLGLVFIIPLHFITLLTALMTMTVWAVLTHLGFELFPSSFPYHWLGKWLIGSTHHSIHHRKYTLHYGLYFTWWDKLIGTQDPNYENEFDKVQEKFE